VGTRRNVTNRAGATPVLATPLDHAAHLRSWFLDHEARVLPLLSFLAVALVWEIAAGTRFVNPLFFSQPSAVLATALTAIQTPTFWGDVSASVSEFLVGYTLAVTLGFVAGVVLGWFRRLALFFEPMVDGLNATPSLALMPLVLIWFGLGTSARVAIVLITTFVPVVLNVYTGVRTVDQGLLRVATSFGAAKGHLIRTVVVPSIAPFGFAGARIGVGRAVSGVVVSEFFAAQSGLAYRIFLDAQVLKTASVLFNALALTFLALGAFKAVGLVERRTLRWRSIGTGSGISQLE
jgi:ABC-type nitrate/sulfonate/bicarbonate transport system permease component